MTAASRGRQAQQRGHRGQLESDCALRTLRPAPRGHKTAVAGNRSSARQPALMRVPTLTNPTPPLPLSLDPPVDMQWAVRVRPLLFQTVVCSASHAIRFACNWRIMQYSALFMDYVDNTLLMLADYNLIAT